MTELSKSLSVRKSTPVSEKYDDFFKTFDQQKQELEQSDEFKVNNLEYDLRTTDWILQKARDSETYAQHLYAAMCNNSFTKDESWSCSWRYAGEIVANMRQEGDYLDYYCSGIACDDTHVPESVVTEEIEEDLKKLGWTVDEQDNDIF